MECINKSVLIEFKKSKSKMEKVNQKVRKKVNIKQLGIELKATRSEKVFKDLYDACKKSVINYYLQYDKNTEDMLKDCYNEAMIAIWNGIHKYDVEKYSISTMIYLKTKQEIIRRNKEMEGKFQMDIDDPIVTNIVVSESDDSTYDMQEDYIRDESADQLWDSIRQILGNDMNFNLLYDKYINNMSTKDLASKYNTKEQNVLNRIFNSKKKITENENNIYNEFYR